MAEEVFPSRAEAIRVIERDRARTLELLGRLPEDAVTVLGVGGGEWSPKDLVGHLESWEELALDAIRAWERGGRSQFEDLRATLDTDGINARNLEHKADLDWDTVRRSADRTYAALIEAIEGMTDERWATVAPGDRGTVGEAFRHDEAHLADLEAFVAAHGGVAGSR
jgi:hypothetical protein